MSIYTYFPKINYKIDEYDSLRAIDITSAIKIKDYLKSYRGILFTPYIVKNGDRPDIVSNKLYGNPNYDWIILIANDMYSVYDDWPKNSFDLDTFIIEKYGSIASALSTVKYYYNSSLDIIDETTYTNLALDARRSETQHEYELRVNSNKSKIKVVKGSLITAITSDLNTISKRPVL
jgi:hypothetical protein